jgi:anti-sigma factor RsiW
VAFISGYLSSDLDPQTARAFEDHLAICGDCVAFLKTYKKTIDLTRAFLTSPTQADRSARASLRLG